MIAVQHIPRQILLWTLAGQRAMAAAKNAEKAPITIKKYANRRLYNTATSKHVTLNDLAHMVKVANVLFRQ